MDDKQKRNKIPDVKTAGEYLHAYAFMLSSALKSIPSTVLDGVLCELDDCLRRRSHIYVAGNGGSSSVAEHLCCDWMKGTHTHDHPSFKVHSLTENTAMLTALSNDVGYEHCVSEQIKMLGEAGDLLVLISSSGSSPNMIQAAKAARHQKIKVLSFTGFSGGLLADLSDLNVHVPVENYGIVEDCHQILMHVFAQFLYLQRTREKVHQPVQTFEQPLNREEIRN